MIGSGRECVIWPKPDRRAGSLGHSMIQPYSEGTVHSSERIASRTSRFRDVPMMLDDQLSCVNGTRVQIEGTLIEQ